MKEEFFIMVLNLFFINEILFRLFYFRVIPFLFKYLALFPLINLFFFHSSVPHFLNFFQVLRIFF